MTDFIINYKKMYTYDVLAIFKFLNGILPMHISILIMLGKPSVSETDAESFLGLSEDT